MRESLVKRVERTLAACSIDAVLMGALATLRLDAKVLENVMDQAASSSTLSSEHDAATPAESQLATSAAVKALESVLVRKFGALVVLDDESTSLPTLLLHVAIVSACGWELDAEEGEEAGVARCEICYRRWSLSSYSTVSLATAPSDVEAADDRAAKRQKVAHAAALDPVAQHRWFCPWATARKQEASHDIGGGSKDDDVAKYGENDARLWEFMRLPGWKQYAKVRDRRRRTRVTVDRAHEFMR